MEEWKNGRLEDWKNGRYDLEGCGPEQYDLSGLVSSSEAAVQDGLGRQP